MGIPSYFSYIIKNYSNIIRNSNFFKDESNVVLDNLFMDCNSIIYDAVRNVEKNKNNILKNEIENSIINDVIINIEKYIYNIKPKNTLFIAFDGVAPFAKMNQQRTRRYKTLFMSKANKINNEEPFWNTSSITPGTKFMENLSKQIETKFKFTENKYNLKKIIISSSNEKGEGEHKLMEYIRLGKNNNETIALYGLDADLIMLSIFHIKYCKNIFVFREAPEFIKSSIPVNIQNSENDLYFLDIENLSKSILLEMQCKYPDNHRIYDYVFICFLLGNDFLPHFPAMNIRTHGINKIIDIYRNFIGNKMDCYFISKDTNKINWKNVGIFLNEIAKREHEYLLNEYHVRDKFDKRKWSNNTPEEKEDFLTNIPVIYRSTEKYISPDNKFWEKRYYKSLFHHYNEEKHEENIKNISMNYIEGLEWVYKYYTGGCPNWKWKYNYHYPPLFKDLVKYIPHFETDFITNVDNNSFLSETQLSYVLPYSQLDLLPNNICNFLRQNYLELYPDNYEFQWAFCRYFWEAHPILPEISIELLEQWDMQFRLNKSNKKT